MPDNATTGVGGSQASLRLANRRLVTRTVREWGPLSQAEIARRTGLSRATVSNIVRELTRESLLVVTRGDRRSQSVSFASSGRLAVGMDFGHSHLRVAVGNLARDVLVEEAVPLDVDASAADGLARAATLMGDLLKAVDADRPDVVGIGLGVPGPVDAATGTLGSSTILPGWVGIDAAAEALRRFGRPIHLDNDANLGTLAELTWGAARGFSDAAYIKLGSGVGAGIVIDGRIYHGPGGTAGEIGHIMLDENGAICRCGNRGCLETYVGGRYLADLLRPAHGDGLSTARIVDLALAGDAPCRRVITDAGRHLGVAVASLCNLLNPRLIVVGGDLARVGDVLLDEVVTAMRRFAIPSAAMMASVVPGVLGERAEVLGALALALHSWEALAV